ncbi:MAG: hypothetical protein P4L53_14700 [Candidatus Obscuribacterales bacterium]|nr:hypothetical protein [Candidatus Obscuribacterales bacterium]
MTGPYAVMYAGDPLNPASFESNFQAVADANWHTIYLKFVHVANADSKPRLPIGGLTFNGDAFFSGGKIHDYNGQPNFADWSNTLLKLKKDGSVKEIYLSVGGGSGTKPNEQVIDFTTIHGIYTAHGNSFKNTELETNFKALRDSFQSIGGTPLIDGIDMDCEDGYTYKDSFIAFCELISELNWKISVAPYMEMEDFWIPVLQALKGKVQRINLQSGALDAANWVAQFQKAGINIDDYVLGDLARFWGNNSWFGECPDDVKAYLQGRSKGITSVVTGGFIYDMDWIVSPDRNHQPPCSVGDGYPTMKQYADAIRAGLAQEVLTSR